MNRPQVHQRQLSRLNIGPPPNAYGDGQTLYMPGPSQQMHTPGPQSAFMFPPNTPFAIGHRPHPSMQFIGPGNGGPPGGFIPPPPHTGQGATFPHFLPPQTPVANGPQQFNVGPPPGFPARQRRQQSISIGVTPGGPPKAALGGPQRKPAPQLGASDPTPSKPVAAEPSEQQKKKKMTVRLPVETTCEEDLNKSDGEDASQPGPSTSRRRAPFARYPISADNLPPQTPSIPPEISTAEIYPPPVTQDLPVQVRMMSKASWNTYKTNLMEDKLSKLGVSPAHPPQPGPTSFIPSHAFRSASVSSADPSLLLARLGQLHHQSPGSSPLSGPQRNLSPHVLPINNPLTPGSMDSPGGNSQQFSPLPPRFLARHGYSMSMAPSRSPSQHSTSPFGAASSNPFGYGALLGGDGTLSAAMSNTSKSPHPPHSLASVSEAVSEEEDNGGQEIRAPRGIAPLRPTFSSPGPSRENASALGTTSSLPSALLASPLQSNDERGADTPEIVTEPVAASTLTREDLMRGFGMDMEETEEGAEYDEDAEGDNQATDLEDEKDDLERRPYLGGSNSAEGMAEDPAEDADDEDVEYEEETDPEDDQEDMADNYDTPVHSRHVSKASLTPSLGAVAAVHNKAGSMDAEQVLEEDEEVQSIGSEDASDVDDVDQRVLDGDLEVAVQGALHEWTGSDEDMVREGANEASFGHHLELEDMDSLESASLSEFSNPSDEERALQEKLHRRQMRQIRKQQELQQQQLHQRHLSSQSQEAMPRRLPPFPTPPVEYPRHPGAQYMNGSNSEEIISNPSEEEAEADQHMRFDGIDGDTYFAGGGLAMHPQMQAYNNSLALHHDQHQSPRHSIASGTPSHRPLPPLPHSREHSNQFPFSASHSHANHSSSMSGQMAAQAAAKDNSLSLNPLAKPFVFGTRPGSSSFNVSSPVHSAAAQGESISTNPSISSALFQSPSHNRQKSSISRLNVAAMEFKPTFTFQPPPGVPSLAFPNTDGVDSRPQPPVSAVLAASGRAVQGREKRRRRGSTAEPEDGEDVGLGSGSGFQFPQHHQRSSVSTPPPHHEDGETATPGTVIDNEGDEADRGTPIVPESLRRGSVLNANAKPFTFSGRTFGNLGSITPTSGLFVNPPPAFQSYSSSDRGSAMEMPQATTYPHQPHHHHHHPHQQSVSEQPSPTHAPISPPGGSQFEGAPQPKKALSMPSASPQLRHISSSPSRAASPELDDLVQSSSTRFVQRSSTMRMPIPDFQTYPVSTNTVPAALFKALVHPEPAAENNAGTAPQAVGPGPMRTRAAVRSRLSSREIFEHASRPSLDDLNVMSISKNMSHRAPVAAPAGPAMPVPEPYHTMIQTTIPTAPPIALAPPPRARERRSSFPARSSDDLQPTPRIATSPLARSESLFSANVVRETKSEPSAVDLGGLEAKVEQLMDKKMQEMREAIVGLTSSKLSESEVTTNAAIGQLVTSVRTQMADSVKRASENGHTTADAHGELDVDLIREIMDQSNQDLRIFIEDNLSDVMQRLNSAGPSSAEPPMEVLNAIEDLHGFVGQTVVTSAEKVLMRLDTADDLARRRPVEERQLLVREIISSIVPHINATRTEPIDIDIMTMRLSEAVKPHISQLIDLASDKKETAALIVQHLHPILQSFVPPRFDLHTMGSQLAVELNRLNPQSDPHLLKEDVADLVVERLAARLAVRDAAFNPDTIASRLTDAIVTPLKHLSSMPSAEAIETLNVNQASLQVQNATLLQRQEELTSTLSPLSDSLMGAAKALANAQSELIAKTKVLGDLEELQKLSLANSDLNIQLGKARSAHGQVRSEKDLVTERLQVVSAERDALRAELEAFKSKAAARESEVITIEAKSESLENALSQALERLKSTDVATQTNLDRMHALEQANRDLTLESHQNQIKLKSFELQATFTARDLEAATHARMQLERERDALKTQQHHWDDLRRTADQVETLARFASQAHNEEVRELKRMRDVTKDLESEHASMQARCADQEARIATLQRNATAAKQTLSQTQQRSAQWEKQAKDLESDADSLRSDLADANASQDQLLSEIAELRQELDSKVNQERAALDREQNLRNQVVTLESQLLSIKTELQEATQAPKTPTFRAPQPAQPIGGFWTSETKAPTRRSTSRSSSTGYSNIGTPKVNGNGHSLPPTSPSPPPKGIWDSIHAPSRQQLPAPASRVQSYSYGRNIPSPSPSVVSIAATEQDDGWWS